MALIAKDELRVILTAKNDAVRAFSSFEKSITGISTAVAGFGIAIGVKAVKEAAKFETAMTNVATLLGKDAAPAIGKLETGIKDLLKVIPKSAEDLGASAYAIVSAGITDMDEALRVLEQSGKLAVAGLGSTAQATDLMTSAVNAFRREGMDASQAADILFTAVKNGKTTVEGLSQGFGSVAASASAAGVKFDELLAATAALTTTGVPAGEAYTQLSSAMKSLQSPTEDMQKLLESLGFRTGEAAIQGLGFVGTLQALEKASRENNISLIDAFGRVEGFKAAVSLADATSESFTMTLSDMRDGVNNLDTAFQRQQATLESQIQLLKNEFTVILVNLGGEIMPDVTDSVKDFRVQIQKSEKDVNVAIKAFGFLGKVTISFLINMLSSLGFAIRAVREGLKLKIDMIRNTIGAFEDFASRIPIIGGLIEGITGKIEGLRAKMQASKEVVENNEKAFGSLPVAADKAGDAAQEMANKYTGAGGSMTESTNKMSDSMKKLEDQAVELSTTINDAFADTARRVAEIQAQIEELTVGRAKNIQSEEERLAKQFVDAEQDVAKLREQIGRASSAEDVRNLQSTLIEKEAELRRFSNLEIVLQGEIAQARQEASMSDLALAVRNFQKKVLLIDQEFTIQKTKLEQQLAKEEEVQAQILAIKLQAEKQAEQFTLIQEKSTIESVNRQIEAFNQLAKAVANARKGAMTGPANISVGVPKFEKGGIVPGPMGAPVPAIVHGGERIIPVGRNARAGSGGMTVNMTITGNNLYPGADVREFAETILDEFFRVYKMQVRT